MYKYAEIVLVSIKLNKRVATNNTQFKINNRITTVNKYPAYYACRYPAGEYEFD